MCKQVFLCYETVMFKFRSPFVLSVAKMGQRVTRMPVLGAQAHGIPEG